MNRLSDIVATDLALSMPLDGMQLIEASAGTGKTFTIAGLYARLIVERQLLPRQILVMTYTRAATEELRQRLRDRLALCTRLATDIATHSDTPMPGSPDDEQAWTLALLQRALAQGDESPAALEKRLRTAVTSMDEAAIFTIHAFCQRVLETHAALLGGGIAGARLEPVDSDLLEDFAADLWVRAAGGTDPETLDALQGLAPSPAKLATLLGALVGFDGALEPSPASLPPAVDMEAAWQVLRRAWQRNGAQAIATFMQWHAAGHLHRGRFGEDSVERLHALAAALDAGTWPQSRELLRFSARKLGGAVNKGKPAFPRCEAFAAIDDWQDRDAADAARRHAVMVQLLHQTVANARTWLARRKRELARFSYDDLIARLATGVTGKGASQARLLTALRAQYPVALVDEFQDTDPRQFTILDTLYRGHGSLFMIGDPKQAIYGFRGGDVHAYLRAAKAATGTHHLDRNFRSTPAMLRAVDAVFTATTDPFIEEGIAFGAVHAGGKVAEAALKIANQPAMPLTLWQPPCDDNGKLPLADDLRARLAGACAATVAGLLGEATLDGRPLGPTSVAVLTNTNAEAALVQDALKARGVSAVCLRQESVYASREAMELLALLDALLVPQSMPRARAALATGLLGRSLADLARMEVDEHAWREALDELADLHECWFARGLRAMLERLARQHAPRLLALADGERRLTNLLQLGETLQSDARRLAGEHAVRNALAQHIREPDNTNEDELLRVESDADSVEIVTLHRSKGLEYDIVLMPFTALMKPGGPPRGSVATFHRDGRAVKRLILSYSAARDPDDAGACAAAAREDLAEDVRKLYVGLTRARHACWMSAGGAVLGHVLGEAAADGKALARAHAAVIASQALPEAVAQVAPVSHPLPLAGARTFTRKLAHDWWVHSFSQLAAGTHDEIGAAGGARDEAAGAPDAAGAFADTASIPSWPRGPRYGNAVHAILERTDFAAWRDAGAEPPPKAVTLMTRELDAAGFTGEDTAGALRTTVCLVTAALRDPVVGSLRLADLPDSDRRAEMEFHFGIAGAAPAAVLALLHKYGYQTHRRDFAQLGNRLRGMMTGIIDLTFRHDRKWWIVDYKTNYLGGRIADYAPDRLPGAIAAHDYDLQYLIYTVAVHRWLRLSLGDAWDYARDFGGVRYLFLRGMGRSGAPGNGIHADRPPPELIDALDTMLRASAGEAA